MYQIIAVLVFVIGMVICVEFCCKKLSRGKKLLIVWTIFFGYGIGNLYATLLARTVGYDAHVELLPFRTYLILFARHASIKPVGSNAIAVFLEGEPPIVGLILNILLYYPLGYLLPILFPKLKPKHVILIGCLCSIATEATQYLLKMGWCETDDVIHNTLGTAIGVWVWMWQSKRLKTVADQKSGQD